MKPSVTCTLGVVLSLTFVLSSVAVAAEAVPRAGTKVASQELPGTLKINQTKFKIKVTVPSHADKLKSKLKELQDTVTIVNNEIPLLEQMVTAMLNKREECLNKTFTTADMTAAGCLPQHSLMQCEEKLYRWCFRNELSAAKGKAQMLDAYYMIKLTAASQASRKIFLEWKEFIDSK